MTGSCQRTSASTRVTGLTMVASTACCAPCHIFFPTRLFPQHLFVGVGVGREGPHRRGGTRLAGGGRSHSHRHGIVAVALTRKGQVEQGRCERELGHNGQERRPSRHPGGLSRWSEVRWDGGGSVAGQEAQEGGCFRCYRKTCLRTTMCYGQKVKHNI